MSEQFTPIPTQPVSGTLTANAGTNLNTSALALETGGNLAAIKTDVDKIPSQGQALAAASMPVVLPTAQITTLTPPAAITGFALETGGNLATLAGAVSSSKFNVNISSGLAATSGGYTIYRNLDTQSTGVNIKNTAGQVYGWYIANNASSVRYVKLYNKATTPAVGTDTPVMTIPVPANSATNVSFLAGIPFATGIGIGGVTGVADNNTGAPTPNDVITNLFYA